MKSRANSSCKSSMLIFDAPVLRAFASSPRNSSSCPMLAQKAIISALYFSLIHERSTEVSNPPEYAKTIFIWVANLLANKREVQRIAKKNLAEGRISIFEKLRDQGTNSKFQTPSSKEASSSKLKNRPARRLLRHLFLGFGV